MERQKTSQANLAGSRGCASAPRSSRAALHPPRLQHTLGNANVQHLLRHPLLQARLTVSRPDDAYEQEADRVADDVMRMPEPAEAAN